MMYLKTLVSRTFHEIFYTELPTEAEWAAFQMKDRVRNNQTCLASGCMAAL
jgi:hypothetical protein